jgi:hypothetical protein
MSDQRCVAKQMMNFLGEVRSAGAINALENSKGWERIESVVDSGATVSVMPPDVAKEYEVMPSVASRSGVTYQVANGDEIDNLGEKTIPVVTDDGWLQGVYTQVAGVTTPLSSVRQMNKAGYVVVFDGDQSFMMNKVNGNVNMIVDNGINYTMGMYVIPKTEFSKMEADYAGFQRQAP